MPTIYFSRSLIGKIFQDQSFYDCDNTIASAREKLVLLAMDCWLSDVGFRSC